MANIIMGFRETLEAILIIIIMYKLVISVNEHRLLKYINFGIFAGITSSIVVAMIISIINTMAAETGEVISKIWEVSVTLGASFLILTLVYMMVKNKENISDSIKEQTIAALSPMKIFILTLFLIGREGVEIVLFMVANAETGNGVMTTLFGIGVGIIFGALIYLSLIEVNLKKIFNITLIYLILQVGFLFGYAVHEFIELLELKSVLLNVNLIHGRLYDLSGTILDQKTSIVGILLNGFFGWTAKPHILQFIAQYAITIYLLILNFKTNNLVKQKG